MMTMQEASNLSRQESRVISLSTEGLGDKEIALAMGISVGTVRTYWKRIQRKIGGNTRAETVSTFVRMGPERELEETRALVEQLRMEVYRRQEAEDRLRAMCACAPLGVFVSGPTGAQLFANAGWERVTGRQMEEAGAVSLADVVHPDDRERFLAWQQEQSASSDARATELRVQTPVGTRWVRCYFSRMSLDGRFLGYMSTLEDVSDRRGQARSTDRA